MPIVEVGTHRAFQKCVLHSQGLPHTCACYTLNIADTPYAVKAKAGPCSQILTCMH
jgi:hypothetical protein